MSELVVDHAALAKFSTTLGGHLDQMKSPQKELGELGRRPLVLGDFAEAESLSKKLAAHVGKLPAEVAKAYAALTALKEAAAQAAWMYDKTDQEVAAALGKINTALDGFDKATGQSGAASA